MWCHTFFTLSLSAVIIATASAQESQTETQPVVVQQPAAPPAFVNLRGFSNDYQVGPGDLLDVQVVGHDDLRQTLRISNSGEISFAMVGRIRVVELTAFQVEVEIARILREKGLVQQAEVLVLVREYQAKPIYVSGAVINPGEFVMSQDLSAVDAILLAGGLRFNAADEALLHRRVGTETRNWSPADIAAKPHAVRHGIEILKVDLRALKEGRFLENAIPLRRGDVLVVPDQQMNPFFVVGEVLDPRNFFYLPGKTIMASQAISWAGGPTRTAKMADGMLVRYDDQGKRQEIKVDYAALLAGKQADFAIHPNDIVFIPGSKLKTIAQGMLSMTDTMVMSTSFRIARSYQMPDRPEPSTRPDPE
jgi:polysaccharide biosynthesis/export protein